MKDSIIQKRAQLSLMAVAALAVFAVAAVILLAGGAPAQATTAKTFTPDSGGGIDLRPVQDEEEPTRTPETTPERTPTPEPHATPEPCPGEEGNPYSKAADTVDSGHIALFDVWWNPEEMELTNSSCPPYIEHKNGEDVRKPSDIDISKTVIHIPNTAKVNLNAPNTIYPKKKYENLWKADDLENPDGDGDRMVWALPACPTGSNPAEGELCISFSAALLNAYDWTGNIVYHVDHVHQIDIDRQDPRYVLVYDVTSNGHELKWDTSNASENEVEVLPGGYDRPVWFFTSAGTYEFQVHVTGTPQTDASMRNGRPRIAPEDNVNGDVREYIIHVGTEADLGVSVTLTPNLVDPDTTLDPLDEVRIQIQATNQGPDAAPNTEVKVALPAGLTDVRRMSTQDGYNLSTDVWNVGNLASGGTDDLLLMANVAPNTRGQELAVKATISATETARDLPVPVADPNPDNNMATGTVTVVSIPNVDPIFKVTRSVAENSPPGTNVGDPIMVRDPDDTSHTFEIVESPGSDKFTVDENTGQVTVATGANLDHECKANYELTLTVSDGKDKHSNNDSAKDTAIDHKLGLDILVSDVTPTVTLTADRTSLPVTESVALTATVDDGPPVCGAQWASYQWHENGSIRGGTGLTENYSHSTASTKAYYLKLIYVDADSKPHAYTSNTVRVTWTDN